MATVYYHWESTSSETAFVRAPASWLGGKRALGYQRHEIEREAAAGAAVFVPRQWSPSPKSRTKTIT